MNAVGLVLLVASVVSGAFGVVFVIESIKQRDSKDKKRTIAYSIGSFLASVVIGLAAIHVLSARTKHGKRIFDDQLLDRSAMTAAMISGTGPIVDGTVVGV